LPEFINPALESMAQMKDSQAMKTKSRLRTREEILALEEKYFGGGLGNLLSLGAAHFRQTGRRAHRNGGASRRRKIVGG
jgi:hypothetical protein